MFGKIVAILLIIGLIALSTKLLVGLIKDIKAKHKEKTQNINKKE